MPRGLREDFPKAVHHVFGRGNHRKDVFSGDEHKREFIKRLIQLQKEEGFLIYAFCMMSNHYHLLIETGTKALSHGMGRLLTGFSRWYNDRTDSVGHVFQGRYGAKLCRDDAYFQWLYWYIHNNPVEAKLVAKPADWGWSSHADILRGQSSIVEVQKALDVFGDTDSYREFVDQVSVEEPGGKSVEQVARKVILETGINVEGIGRQRGEMVMAAKRLFIQEALSLGIRQAELAEYLACSPAAVSQLVKVDGNELNFGD